MKKRGGRIHMDLNENWSETMPTGENVKVWVLKKKKTESIINRKWDLSIRDRVHRVIKTHVFNPYVSFTCPSCCSFNFFHSCFIHEAKKAHAPVPTFSTQSDSHIQSHSHISSPQINHPPASSLLMKEECPVRKSERERKSCLHSSLCHSVGEKKCYKELPERRTRRGVGVNKNAHSFKDDVKKKSKPLWTLLYMNMCTSKFVSQSFRQLQDCLFLPIFYA